MRVNQTKRYSKRDIYKCIANSERKPDKTLRRQTGTGDLNEQVNQLGDILLEIVKWQAIAVKS